MRKCWKNPARPPITVSSIRPTGQRMFGEVDTGSPTRTMRKTKEKNREHVLIPKERNMR
jgi:hypothetical protein